MNIVLVSLSVQNLSGVKVPPHLLSLSAASYRDVCSLAVLVPLSLKGQRLSERQIGGRLTLRSLSHPEEPWMEQNNTRLHHSFPCSSGSIDVGDVTRGTLGARLCCLIMEATPPLTGAGDGEIYLPSDQILELCSNASLCSRRDGERGIGRRKVK